MRELEIIILLLPSLLAFFNLTGYSSAMGKSRSATICIAYLLHQQPSSLTPASALAVLRESRPLCEPNEGFMEQLSLYHQMGCPDDVINHPLYSRWLYHREVEASVACGRGPELNSVLFEDDQSRRTAQTEDGPIEIKCRKCRSVHELNLLAVITFIKTQTANCFFFYFTDASSPQPRS